MSAEDRLKELNTQCSGLIEMYNLVKLTYKHQFVTTLTGQRCELKSRSANNLCGVNLNSMIFVDSTPLCILKTNRKREISVFLPL